MARIPTLREDDSSVPEDARAALEQVHQQRGRIVNLYRVMANHPRVLQKFVEFGSTTYRGGSLTPVQAELAYTTATVVNNCYY